MVDRAKSQEGTLSQQKGLGCVGNADSTGFARGVPYEKRLESRWAKRSWRLSDQGQWGTEAKG